MNLAEGAGAEEVVSVPDLKRVSGVGSGNSTIDGGGGRRELGRLEEGVKARHGHGSAGCRGVDQD